MWCRVARQAVGPEGHVVPQQWLAHTTVPGVASDDRRQLDPVIYGATPLGGAICCDATLVSALPRDGATHAGAPSRDGAVLQVAERHPAPFFMKVFDKLDEESNHGLCKGMNKREIRRWQLDDVCLNAYLPPL